VYAWAENVTLAAPTTQLALQSGDAVKECAVDIAIRVRELWRKVKKCLGKIKRLACGSRMRLQMGKVKKNPTQAGNTKVSRSKGKNDVTYKARNKPVDSIADPPKGKDEYQSRGPVEIVASAIGAATGAISDVPVIGPYMTATSFVANTAANVASFFGWSNPPVIENQVPHKNMPFYAMTSPEISQPIEKLTLDPKNELCVDSRTVGLDGTDELTVESIVTREAHLFNILWQQSDAVDTLLYSHHIKPANCRGITGKWFPGPMAHLSQLFRFWRGDIILRFQVIASRFHNGKLRISWDPVKDIDTVTDAETVTFTRTYDIAQDTDFEIRVPYMQAQAWLKTSDFKSDYGTATGAVDPEEDNGQLTVLSSMDLLRLLQLQIFILLSR
jgi:hypothetical protein